MGDPPRAIEQLPPLRDVVRRFGLDARHALGQHFLLDLNLTARIARAAGELSGCDVIEVGPGPGGLTRALLEAGARRVVAIERDPRCVAALAELGAAVGERLQVVTGDALETDGIAATTAPRRIVANLPFNIATPLLIGWLQRIDTLDGMTLMFQREVADRILAGPGSKTYGRLSVMAQWRCRVARAFNVPRDAFTPRPKVMSTVVTFAPLTEPVAAATWPALEAVVAAAFGQRRKMLRASLRPLGIDPAAAGIASERRAEDLDVAEFCALARLHAQRS